MMNLIRTNIKDNAGIWAREVFRAETLYDIFQSSEDNQWYYDGFLTDEQKYFNFLLKFGSDEGFESISNDINYSDLTNEQIENITNKLSELDDELGYFAFLDADDLWYKNSVSDEILSEINAGQYDIISFSCYCSNTSVDRLSISNVYQNKSIQISMGGTTEWLLDSHLGSNFFRCSLIRDNGLRFMETIQYNEDIIFMREALFCAKKVSLRSNFLHIYRANATSVTHRRKCLISTATDIAKAWYQVGDWAYGIDVPQAQRENWKAFCVSISASRLLEAARNLAEAGYTVVEINKCIQSVSFCRNIELLHPEEMAAWQLQDLMMYKTNFRKFVLVHRIRGGIHRISKLLLKIRAVQIIREKQKFPIRMS